MRVHRQCGVTAGNGRNLGCHDPLSHPHVFEPVRPAVFLVEEVFSIGESSCHASFALLRFGAVEVGNVLVADIAEPATRFVSISKPWQSTSSCGKDLPVYPTCILKQPQRYRMYRRIPPPLIKEPPSAIQMVEIVLIRLTPPELHICDLEVAPEMTRRVSIRFLVVSRPPLFVLEPRTGVHGAVFDVIRVGLDELEGFGPQCGDGLGGVVEVYGEAVGFVVVLHVAENVVVDVAEEMDLGFDSPVVAYVLESGVVVEKTAVPAAHLVVGD